MATLTEQLYQAVLSDFPDHQPGTRAVHSVGISAEGYFVANRVAPQYTVAEPFQGQEVPAIVRFSNGVGSPVERDSDVDARGMAVKLFPDTAAEMDLVSMTLPVFFASTPEEFLLFSKAAVPEKVHRDSWLVKLKHLLSFEAPDPKVPEGVTMATNPHRIAAYAAQHPDAHTALAALGQLMTPESYLRLAYHAVHAFSLIGPDGRTRLFRLQWHPDLGVQPNPNPTPPLNYLHQDLRERLAAQAATFTLQAYEVDTGDDSRNPTLKISFKRRRITLGRLVLRRVVDDQDARCERLSFNPCRLPDPGFGVSDDPVLLARKAVYELGCKERHGSGCPVAPPSTTPPPISTLR